MIGPTQRPLPNDIQHSEETVIHAASGIRTRNPGKRVAVDPRFRTRGHWYRLANTEYNFYYSYSYYHYNRYCYLYYYQ